MLKKLGLLKNTPNQEMYSLKELVKVQEQIKQKIILKDVLPKKITTIAGVDQSFPQKDKIISAIVVCNYPSMRLIEPSVMHTSRRRIVILSSYHLVIRFP